MKEGKSAYTILAFVFLFGLLFLAAFSVEKPQLSPRQASSASLTPSPIGGAGTGQPRIPLLECMIGIPGSAASDELIRSPDCPSTCNSDADCGFSVCVNQYIATPTCVHPGRLDSYCQLRTTFVCPTGGPRIAESYCSGTIQGRDTIVQTDFAPTGCINRPHDLGGVYCGGEGREWPISIYECPSHQRCMEITSENTQYRRQAICVDR